MRRHTVLAAAATPLLVLTFALAAQTASADDPSGEASTAEVSGPPVDLSSAPLPEVVVPVDGTLEHTPDPAVPAAEVQITLAATDVVPDAVLVSGFVVGVETGGLCTLTLTQGEQILTIEAEAEADATTTVCGGLTMSTADMAPGLWDATLTYSSPTMAGISSAVQVAIG